MSALLTFDDLLRKLGHQHELEVRTLREQVVQLQKEARRAQSPTMLEKTKDETTASTFDPGFEDDKGCLPSSTPPLICHPVVITKPDDEIIINGNGESSEAPDPEALEAAFAVALDERLDESTDLDDVLKEIAVKVARDRIQDPGRAKFAGDEFNASPVPSPQAYPQPRVNEDAPWWDQQVQLSGDIDLLSDQVASHQARSREREVTKVHTRERRSKSSRQTTVTVCTRVSARSVILKDGDAAMALKKFDSLEPPVTAMGRWERFVDYVSTVQFLDALPKVNPAWAIAAKEDVPNNKSMLRMHNFKSFVLKNNSTSGPGGGHDPGIGPDGEKLPKHNILIRTMQPLMMHPTCRRRVIWDIGGITLLLHDVIFIPIQQAFESDTQGLGTGYEDFLSVLDMFGASFWTVDIFVSFLTGYYSNEGFVELWPVSVARHYLRSWFPMDLMIVSVDWCTMFIGMSAASGYMRLGKTVSRIMRVLRLLRFLKMNASMRELMERINSEYLLQLVNLMKTLILIVIVNHYIACVWYGVGAASFSRSRWTEKFLVNYPGSFPYAYATALHWSLTQFTPASMEVVPQNAVERFFTIFVIINALVAFSSFVSSITAAMTHIRNINARQVQEEASIRQFFSEHKISHGTASRVWHFVRKNKTGNVKRLKVVDVPALKNLPPKIREDLRLEIYLPILGEHAFFSEIHGRDKNVLIKICNTAITEKTLHIGQELFGDCKQNIPAMFFVSMGTLMYCAANENDEEPTQDTDEIEGFEYMVNRQEWACEAALWADRATTHGFFVAVNGGVEAIVIDAEKAGNVLKASATCVAFSAKYAELFMNSFRDQCCISNYNAEAEVNLLFNDKDATQKRVQKAKDAIGDQQRNSLGRAFPFLGQGFSSTNF